MAAARYIWPTSRGWIIAFGSVIGLLISLIHQTLFSFILTSTAIAVALVSFVSALLALRGLKIRRAPCADALVGQMISIPLEITNLKGRLRQNMVIIEQLGCTPERETISIVPVLQGHETLLLPRLVPAVHRGEFQLKSLLLRSSDPAGLFYRERLCQLPVTVTVYPSYVTLQDLFIQRLELPATATGQPLSTAGSSQDFFGVREYHQTDGLRHIHWRSSARYGKLMVKDFERNALSSVAILLDAQKQFVSRGMISNLEYLIQAAASIAHYCSGMYCSLSLAAGGKIPLVVPPELSSLARAEVMYRLATLQEGTIPLTEVVDDLLPRLPRNSVIFCLSLHDSPVLQKILEDYAERGMEIRWCCAGRKDFSMTSPGQDSSPASVFESEGRRGSFVRAVRLTPEMNLERALNMVHHHDDGFVMR